MSALEVHYHFHPNVPQSNMAAPTPLSPLRGKINFCKFALFSPLEHAISNVLNREIAPTKRSHNGRHFQTWRPWCLYCPTEGKQRTSLCTQKRFGDHGEGTTICHWHLLSTLACKIHGRHVGIQHGACPKCPQKRGKFGKRYHLPNTQNHYPPAQNHSHTMAQQAGTGPDAWQPSRQPFSNMAARSHFKRSEKWIFPQLRKTLSCIAT